MIDEALPEIFVYGTLKRGFCRHHALGADAEFLGFGTVWGRLFDQGAYPGLVLDPQGDASAGLVQGEIWRLSDLQSTLPELDRVEGRIAADNPQNLFSRMLVDASINGSTLRCLVYVLGPRTAPGTPLPGGVWPQPRLD